MNALAMPAGARPIVRGLPILLARSDDPHAELMALIWGPRFDREHAFALLARQAVEAPVQIATLFAGITAAAEGFDALSARQKARLRSIIRRHRARIERAGDAGCDNAPCLASS